MEREEKFYTEILVVSKETGLPVKKILDMLFHLQEVESIENNELLRKLGVSRNVMNQVKERLSEFLDPSSGLTALSVTGKKDVEMISDLMTDPEEFIINTDNEKVKKTIELLERHKGKRPESKREYDQFTATFETTARRACLMDFFADIRGKRILFLGDDDFTSLAVASFKSAKNIHILDIDQRILDGLKSSSSEEKLKINTSRYNAVERLPQNYKGNFDVVFTDPPYTSDGVALFLSRAIDALDSKNQSARIYFCYGNSDRAKERFLPIYEVFSSSGLMIRWVFDKFNRYQGAEFIGSASSLFILDVTSKTKPLVVGNYDKPIYTNN